ncbi:MAG TPA: trypsin-like peptidase domain-containing protein [Bryobacteraceae bacterium]|nr:trypsin-like peptidase domain-containing protein [Bryobacteraceae bacterium]
MRILRPLAWAMILVAGFVYITSVTHWNFSRVRSIAGAWSEPAAAAPAYSPDEQNNIDIYKSARDATVNITSVTMVQNWFMQVFPQQGTGSGFIINPDGQILTNNHVVQGAQTLTVKLSDQKEYKAKVLARDPRSDLALIRIDASRKLPCLKLGESDNLVVGQKVLAIGNPFGFSGTLTTGIVSSLDRSIQTEDSQIPLEGMIQTDAAINPGNSGGPLLDSHGDVIGINTAIYGQSYSGIGFAMPIDRAKTMLAEIQKNGKISMPAPLGISTIFVTGDLADALRLPSNGLLIERVKEGSAADEAGLRGPTDEAIVLGRYQLGIGGDYITEVEGQPITGNETLQRAIAKKRGGDILELTVYRRGKSISVKVKLAEAPQVI